MSGSGDRHGGGPPGSDGAWETMGKKDDAPLSGSDPEVENVDGNNTSDDDDDLSDDISDDYDSDASEKSFETRKRNKCFKGFFEVLNALSVEQIHEQTRKWHCPACKNGPGAFRWFKGLQPLMTHARTKGSKRVLHRELAALLEEELSRRGTSVIPASEQFGKWNSLRESTETSVIPAGEQFGKWNSLRESTETSVIPAGKQFGKWKRLQESTETLVIAAGKQFGKWKGLRESTDQEIVWPPDLYGAVMYQAGFSEESLIVAYSHLLDNKAQGDAFVGMSEDDRVLWLRIWLAKHYYV